jgi:hypothetical protein
MRAAIVWIGAYVALFAVIVVKSLQESLGKRRERKK